MPFAPHYRVTCQGKIGLSGGERFSYGLNMTFNNGPLPDVLDINSDTLWGDVRDDLVAFHGRAASAISPAAYLDMVKIAKIGADGLYTADPRIYEVNVQGGGSASGYAKPQLAMVVSLNTARRGATGRGRFYLPLPEVISVAADGWKVSLAVAEGIRGSAETLVQDLNNIPGPDLENLRVVVASSKGYNSPVTSVRVGRIVDTVRTRRNKLQEDYTSDASVS